MVAWLNGMVAGLLCGLMTVVGWLDDGGCVGCLRFVRGESLKWRFGQAKMEGGGSFCLRAVGLS